MPAQIFRQLSEAGALLRSALIGLGVVLFVLTIGVNISARRIVVVVDRRIKGTGDHDRRRLGPGRLPTTRRSPRP